MTMKTELTICDAKITKLVSNFSNIGKIRSNELNPVQFQHLIKRLPKFELSYETIAHKKVFPAYNACLSIPNGKKYIAWFSFDKNKDVCYLMELNKEKTVTKATTVDTIFHNNLSKGTILYGTVIPLDKPVVTTTETQNPSQMQNQGKRFFVIEDIFFYKGIPLKNTIFGEKLGYIEDFVKNQIVQKFSSDSGLVFTLPVLWGINENEPREETIFAEYEKIKENISYNVHHLQLRKLTDIAPYINLTVSNVLTKLNKQSNNTNNAEKAEQQSKFQLTNFIPDFRKHQYRFPTVFQVSADIQFDVYHLFACGKNHNMVYYGVSYIPNLKTSIFMNNLFRNIRENKNLDYIEESDDEADFENTAEDKYVDLNKTLNIECSFHQKFKKWVPIRVVGQHEKIIHISKLVDNYY